MNENRYKNKFWDKPLKLKFLVLTLIVAIIPFIVFFGATATLYNNAYEKRNNQQIKEDLSVITNRIDSVFENTVLCSNYVTLNLNNVNDEKNKHQIDKDNMIKSVLNQTVLIFDGIESLVFIDANNQIYVTRYSLYSKKDEIVDSRYMRNLQLVKNGTTVLFDNASDCMQKDDGSPVVTMGKRVIEISSGETLGFLFVNLDIKYLEASMDNEITHYYLLDTKGNFIVNYTDDQEDKLEAILEKRNEKKNFSEMDKVRVDHTNYLIGEMMLSDYNWEIIGVTDLDAYNVSFREIVHMAFFVVLITIVLFVSLSYILTKIMVEPIKELTDGAKEIATGNLDVVFEFKHDDEIGELGKIFNHMTKEISMLFKRVDEEAKKKTEYELSLVQEQVKPHFLYNTLDIIIVLIEMNKSKEAARVTKKLADYYKNSLSSSVNIIPLEKEVRIVEDYLDLQLIRYKDKFSYDIKMDETLSQVLVPKMTLQPLVENSIYHGLKYKEDWGNINISIIGEADSVVINVTDDGIGMSEQKLADILGYKDNPDKHFGVYSVIHRLKLYYGDLCNIEVTSKEGLGTTFLISIPKDWKGTDSVKDSNS